MTQQLPQSIKVATIAIAFLCNLVLPSHSKGDNGVNAAAFHTLCSALQLGDGTISIEPPIVKPPEAPTAIYNLNMSVAAKEWQNRFYKRATGDAPPTATKKPENLSPEWNSKWEAWTTAAIAVNAQPPTEALLKDASIGDLTSTQRTTASVELSKIAEAAFDIYTNAKAQKAAKPDNEILKTLRSAVNGETTAEAATTDGTKAFSAANQAYTAACTTGSPAKATKTVLGALFCLCVVPNTQTNKPCVAEATHPTWDSSDQEPKSATYTLLRNLCPTVKHQKLTAAKLHQAISQLSALFTGKTTAAYIGEQGDSCNGSNNGACIKYAGAATSGIPNLDSITWLSALNTVAQDISDRQEANRQATQATEELAHLKRMAKQIIAHAHLTPKKSQETQPTKQTDKLTNKAATDEDCNAAKDNQEQCDKLKDKK
ncbi:Trypanosomal VSG domain containing protein, putative [Trypanosoma equiperdum]|uniref:Trypanosomal VSG domain containing protein, putative n=1 Tax=Trypanosoma equiperdum TaxID=5694 RepID=A0A1G4I437_TRYEQ|nr:Trypanosomal VSG domain containing protein, putative [Trypanosoma equiperdum]